MITRRRARRFAARLGVSAATAGLVLAGMVVAPPAPAAAASRYPIRAASDGRTLVSADGRPYLYVADTPWLSLAKLDQADFRHLLDTRKSQGFNTLQVLVLDMPHLGPVTNVYGDAPLNGTNLASPRQVGARTHDAASPDYDYWDHIDWALDEAGARGMQLALAPSWYGYLGEDWRRFVTSATASSYGSWVARRLGHKTNLVWILGGDNDPNAYDTGRTSDKSSKVDATNRMAGAIRASEPVRHLMSYHAKRRQSSAQFFGAQAWHTVNFAYSADDTWRTVGAQYGKGEPVIVPEAFYWGNLWHPIDNRRLRAQAYWSFLSGAAGFAYGHENVWDIDGSWRTAIGHSSAWDIQRASGLLRGRAFEKLRPSGDMLSDGDDSDGLTKVTAAVATDRSHGYAYFPVPRGDVVLNRARFTGTVKVGWFNPATGATRAVGTYGASGTQKLPWPTGYADAVLVVTRV
jgi:hypothetical protein